MNAADKYHFEKSRKDLAAEILKQAALDLRRFQGATSGIERELYLDAHIWVTSDDCTWPFSFLNVCQLLNIAPETVRQDVLGAQSLGVFGYLIRRCGRAARKVQIVLGNTFTNGRTTNTAEPVTQRMPSTNIKAPALKLRRILRPV